MNIIKTLNKKLCTVKTNSDKQRCFQQNHVLSQNIYQNRNNMEIVDNNIVISTKNVYEYTQQITKNCIFDFVNEVNSRKKVNAKIIIKKDYNTSKIDCFIYDKQLENKNLYFCVDKEKSPLFFYDWELFLYKQ